MHKDYALSIKWLEHAMALDLKSYFAGVGTVFAAIVLGFAGGAGIMSTPQINGPNRLERVMSSTPVTGPPSQPEAVLSVNAQTVPLSAPMVAVSQLPVSGPGTLQAPLPASQPQLAKEEDPTVESDKVQAVQIRKVAERKRSEERRFAQRKRRREIEAVANAVRQIKPAGVIAQVADQTPVFGFFGSEDR